jgi:hypothetical protein
MAVVKGYICDECGARAQRPDRWLLLQAIDLKDLERGRKILGVKSELDFCSPGCVIRWISKRLSAPIRTVDEKTALVV